MINCQSAVKKKRDPESPFKQGIRPHPHPMWVSNGQHPTGNRYLNEWMYDWTVDTAFITGWQLSTTEALDFVHTLSFWWIGNILLWLYSKLYTRRVRLFFQQSFEKGQDKERAGRPDRVHTGIQNELCSGAIPDSCNLSRSTSSFQTHSPSKLHHFTSCSHCVVSDSWIYFSWDWHTICFISVSLYCSW